MQEETIADDILVQEAATEYLSKYAQSTLAASILSDKNMKSKGLTEDKKWFLWSGKCMPKLLLNPCFMRR